MQRRYRVLESTKREDVSSDQDEKKKVKLIEDHLQSKDEELPLQESKWMKILYEGVFNT